VLAPVRAAELDALRAEVAASISALEAVRDDLQQLAAMQRALG